MHSNKSAHHSSLVLSQLIWETSLRLLPEWIEINLYNKITEKNLAQVNPEI